MCVCIYIHIQDILLFIWGLCTGQYHSWHSTPPLLKPPAVVLCNQSCAIYGVPPAPWPPHNNAITNIVSSIA